MASNRDKYSNICFSFIKIHAQKTTHTMNCTHTELHLFLTKILNLFVLYAKNIQFSLLYLIYSIGGYDRNKNPPLTTTNPILRKWVQFRVGAIPSEPTHTQYSLHSTLTPNNFTNTINIFKVRTILKFNNALNNYIFFPF